MRRPVLICLFLVGVARPVLAQVVVSGVVRNEIDSALPGVLVELHEPGGQARETLTDAAGMRARATSTTSTSRVFAANRRMGLLTSISIRLCREPHGSA